MSIVPKAIHIIDDYEIHMLGEVVAVKWQLKTTKTKEVMPDGSHVTTERSSRRGPPYIDFVQMRQDRDGTWYEDDDSPVSGGISETYAQQLVQELQQAITYLAEKKATVQ